MSDRYNNSRTIIVISNERRASARLSLFWRAGALERLVAENLGSRYDSSSACRVRSVKKKRPPLPPVPALLCATHATPRIDTRTIYQSVGRKPEPNCRAFSCGPRSQRFSVSRAGFHSGGKLRRRSFLHPALAVEMAQHDGAIEQGEADPQAVGREQRN